MWGSLYGSPYLSLPWYCTFTWILRRIKLLKGFGAHAVCCWGSTSSTESRGVTVPRAVICSSPAPPGWVSSVPFLQWSRYVTFTSQRLPLPVFFVCSVCSGSPPSPVPAPYPDPALEMLTVFLGSRIRDPWAGLLLSHPCSLCCTWCGDFRFPDQLGSWSVHASLHGARNPDERCVVSPGNPRADSSQHEETFTHSCSDGRLLF